MGAQKAGILALNDPSETVDSLTGSGTNDENQSFRLTSSLYGSQGIVVPEKEGPMNCQCSAESTQNLQYARQESENEGIVLNDCEESTSTEVYTLRADSPAFYNPFQVTSKPSDTTVAPNSSLYRALNGQMLTDATSDEESSSMTSVAFGEETSFSAAEYNLSPDSPALFLQEPSMSKSRETVREKELVNVAAIAAENRRSVWNSNFGQ